MIIIIIIIILVKLFPWSKMKFYPLTHVKKNIAQQLQSNTDYKILSCISFCIKTQIVESKKFDRLPFYNLIFTSKSSHVLAFKRQTKRERETEQRSGPFRSLFRYPHTDLPTESVSECAPM